MGTIASLVKIEHVEAFEIWIKQVRGWIES